MNLKDPTPFVENVKTLLRSYMDSGIINLTEEDLLKTGFNGDHAYYNFGGHIMNFIPDYIKTEIDELWDKHLSD